MINVLRKHSQWLMISITFLVIISFVWLYNSTQFQKIGAGTVATIYGRNLAREDFQRYDRQAQLAQGLGLYDLLQFGMSQRGFSPEAFAVNSMVLEHAASQLGITSTSAEVFQTVQGLAPFQTNNAFDPSKYQQFITTTLPSLGMNDVEIEKLVKLQLAAAKLRALISGTAPASAAQFRQLYTAQYQKLEIAFVNYQLADFIAAVKLTEADLQKAFADRKDALNSEEKRRVDYVVFGLTDAEQKLTGKPRTDALQKIANAAQSFSQSLLEKNAQFTALAEKAGAPVLHSSLFTQAQVAAPFADIPNAAEAAFALTKTDPNSDILQTPAAFYIFHLAEIVPSQPLTFEQAKADLSKELTAERAQTLLAQKGAEDHAKLETALKTEKDFAKAALAVGLKPETTPPFSLAEPPKDEAKVDPAIINKSATLADGQTSAYTPSATGGFILHMTKREPITDAQFDKDAATMKPAFDQQQATMVFEDWLRNQIKAAKYESKLRS